MRRTLSVRPSAAQELREERPCRAVPEAMEFGGGTDYSSHTGARTMSQTLINTLRFADRLKEAGFTAVQAEALARSLGDELTEQLPSKADFQDLRADFKTLRADFNALDASLNGRMDALESRLDGRIDTLESKVDGRIDALESKIDGRIDALESKVDGRIDALEADLGGQIETLAAKIDSQRVAFNLVLAALGVLIALVGVLVAIGLVEPVSNLVGA